MYASNPLISPGFKLFPYAGILFLPFSIVVFRSASDFVVADFVKSVAPILFPAGVSPLPVTPWHTAHFDLYKDALWSCACNATPLLKLNMEKKPTAVQNLDGKKFMAYAPQAI
jgi:hypothetical protein